MATDYKTGTWNLFYWPGFRGRGDLVRLMFEVAGVSYNDVCNGSEPNPEKVLAYYQQNKPDKIPSFPVLAPPIVQHCSADGSEDFLLSQSVAILHFLGKQFGLCPEGEVDNAHAHQLALTVADFIAEGHDAYHPICRTGTYESQKEKAKEFIKRFKDNRLPRYLKYFETVYKKQQEQFSNGSCLYHFVCKDKDGTSQPTYADIAVYHAVCVTENTFKTNNKVKDNEAKDDKVKDDEVKDDEVLSAYTKLCEFKKNMDEHPKIQDYNKRTKLEYCGHSLM